MSKCQTPPIRHSVYIEASPVKVFGTLTTADGWNAWFTQETTIDLKMGGTVMLRWRDWGVDHDTVEDGGEITSLVPNKHFAFRWHRTGKPTTVSFELEELGSGTRLTVMDNGYGSTEQDLRICLGCAAGWGEAMMMLKVYLEHGIVYGDIPKA